MAANDNIFVLWKPDLFGDSDNEVQEIQGVVLPSRKVLGKSKQYLETNIQEAQKFWEEDGNSDEIPLEKLFEYLQGVNMRAYSMGRVLPIDDAREFVKKGGGL
tara:strand:+ start:279 stop:587 length:309 start_codon:yes stop_codon:yes gene_type:complete